MCQMLQNNLENCDFTLHLLIKTATFPHVICERHTSKNKTCWQKDLNITTTNCAKNYVKNIKRSKIF